MKKVLIWFTATLLYTACQTGEPQPHDHDHDHEPGISLSEAASLQLDFQSPCMVPAGDVLEVRGMVHAPPQSRYDVSLPVQGTAVHILHYEGEKVRQGEPLARIRSLEYINLQEQYLEHLAALNAAEAAYRRQTELGSQGATSEKLLEEARASMQATRARWLAVKTKIEATGAPLPPTDATHFESELVLRAPADGYITEVRAHVGMAVEASMPIYRMVDPSHLHIELALLPAQVELVKPGMKVQVAINGLASSHTATVHLVSRTVSEESRTVNAHLHPDGEIPGLMPGMYATAYIATGADSTWALPRSAAVRHEGKWMAVVREGEKLVAIPLTDRQVTDRHVLPAPGDTRVYVTQHAQRALAAILGREAEHNHSH